MPRTSWPNSLRRSLTSLGSRLRARARDRRRDERGSVAFIVVMWSIVVVALAGLVIDGSLMISQRERAADLAAQAARAQAENLDANLLRSQGKVVIAAPTPCTLAQQYLNQVSLPSGEKAYLDTGAPGTAGTGCALEGGNVVGNSVEVCVAVPYNTVLIDLRPIATACATAHATAQQE
jgi:Flp pilus assembly protein TadG